MKFSCRSNLLSVALQAAIITLTIKPKAQCSANQKNEGKVEATKMFVQQNWAVYWDEIFLMLRIKLIAYLIGEGDVGVIYDCHRSNQTSPF
ncbi:hypothetical protein MTR67_037572 [Solanum verrucosum]|uniref:Uncharacterized protein n=1 Tax=Solanum verrucosum TaxID=315347 RepID=A0AAF0UDW3_SOLVR|nr:hypothetical protein MTR67_037572 [Solanum verrucosum]